MSHTPLSISIHHNITLNLDKELDVSTVKYLLESVNCSNLSIPELTKTLNLDIAHFIDARNLACPQPLLKAKVALRSIDNHRTLYLVASDANSQYDIQSYGDYVKLSLLTFESTINEQQIWHFLITPNNQLDASS